MKSANLMLCEHGGMVDVIKVLDFGLVKLPKDDVAVAVTGTDGVVATPQYMSPT